MALSVLQLRGLALEGKKKGYKRMHLSVFMRATKNLCIVHSARPADQRGLLRPVKLLNERASESLDLHLTWKDMAGNC